MIIAIGSKRGPKVEAVQRVVPKIQRYLDPLLLGVEYLTYEIEGGIAMPRTLVELMNGAEQRVLSLRQMMQKENKSADYFIGMEGGFHRVAHNGKNIVFLQSWAYVSNGETGYFGSSGDITIPENIAREVMEHGRELSVVIDEAMQTTDIRSKQGTWGVLTKDLLTRRESFEIALMAAFAPFYNAEVY